GAASRGASGLRRSGQSFLPGGHTRCTRSERLVWSPRKGDREEGPVFQLGTAWPPMCQGVRAGNREEGRKRGTGGGTWGLWFLPRGQTRRHHQPTNSAEDPSFHSIVLDGRRAMLGLGHEAGEAVDANGSACHRYTPSYWRDRRRNRRTY